MPAPYPLIREGEEALAARAAAAWKAKPVHMGPKHRVWFLVRDGKKAKALAEFQVIDAKWEEIAPGGISVPADRLDAARAYNLVAGLPFMVVVQCGWRVMWTALKSLDEIKAALADPVEGRCILPSDRFRPLGQG